MVWSARSPGLPAEHAGIAAFDRRIGTVVPPPAARQAFYY